MQVVTMTGVVTSTKWWDRMKVCDQAVVVERGDEEKAEVLVLAELASVSAAGALFEAVNSSISSGKRIFRIDAWLKANEVLNGSTPTGTEGDD